VLATSAVALDPMLIGGDGQGRTIGSSTLKRRTVGASQRSISLQQIFRRGGRGVNKTPQAETQGCEAAERMQRSRF